MWIVNVLRPILDSETENVAGPGVVRWRKVRERERACGWFWVVRGVCVEVEVGDAEDGGCYVAAVGDWRE